MQFSVEVTIPVLNEAATLERQVRRTHTFLCALERPVPAKLVIADNGSTDDTPRLARALADELPGLRYLRLEERGVGRALKAAWLSSDADIVGSMDLDLSTDLKSLPDALSLLDSEQAHIVAGSRLAPGASVTNRTPLRTFTSVAFNTLVRLLFQTRFTDGMCGFKFLRRNIVPDLMRAGADSDGWFFETEVLIAGEYLGYRVADLPVVWTDDPDTKVRVIPLALEYLRAMRRLRGRLPQRRQAR